MGLSAHVLFLSSQHLHLETPGCGPHWAPEQGWPFQSLESGPTLVLRTPAVRVPRKWKAFVLLSGHCAVPGALTSSGHLGNYVLSSFVCLFPRWPSVWSYCRARQPCRDLQSCTRRSLPSSQRSSLSFMPSGFATVMPSGYLFSPSSPAPHLSPDFDPYLSVSSLWPWYGQKSPDRELN